ncbi:DUF6146 family protein [Oceanihabitans sp.]|nr:DUF6146 family protein [Oceanihabitans sp.]
MKSVFYFILICALLSACNTSKNISIAEDSNPVKNNDTISISNNELEYEVIIIEPGFRTWLESSARPEAFYSQSFLEKKNIQYVSAWNSRALNPLKFDPNLYEMQINYQQGIDYGFEVNYILYNYFIYFQNKYKQQLAGIVPKR